MTPRHEIAEDSFEVRVDSEIAVVGLQVVIKVASSEDFAGAAVGEFSSFEVADDSVDDPAGLTPKTHWTEPLLMKKIQGGKTTLWGAEWVAGIESSKSQIPETTHLIQVVVQHSNQGNSVPARNRIRIPGIAVSDLGEMKELLIQEFSKKSSGSQTWEFNPDPLRNFIRSLSPQQRLRLCSYDKKCLVAFVSLRGNRTDHLMCADECAVSGTRRSVLSNADFSMFSCQKKGYRVFLDFHTEYFCFNTQNTAPGPNTPKFLNSMYNSLSPDNKHPRKLWLTAEAHEHVIYMKVCNGHYDFDEDGTTIKVGNSVMGNNYIHGMINTAGCWMLLRNYNWPQTRSSEFLSIYIRDFREGTSTSDEILAKLASLGYDVLDDNGQRSSSERKWYRWDLNYAYNFFFERLVGIDFFADSKVDSTLGFEPNLHNTHGHVQNPPTFTQDEKSFEKSHRYQGNASGNDIHHNHGKTIGDGVWRATNVRGMPTAKGWGKAFADCFIFNPQNLSLTQLKQSPYVDPPATVPLPTP